MNILNLTQHNATPDQLSAGVVDIDKSLKDKLVKLLTFIECPDVDELKARAFAIAELANGFDSAMIGGAPYLMRHLEDALEEVGIKPVYAFSKRMSVESVNGDGSVTKTAVFIHSGFISAF